MSYHIYLFTKETQEQNTGFNFLEKDELVTKFTDEQFETLKKRLLQFDYKIEGEEANQINFNFRDRQFGISVSLSKQQLSFSSSFTEDGVFEISMTALEFTDSGEFSVFDPQQGKWEKI